MEEPEDQLPSALHGVVVILDNLRSAFNVGSIFRTADACGVERIYLCGITARPPNQKLDKTALGATEFVPWEYRSSTHNALEQLSNDGVPVLCVEISPSSKSLWKVHFPERVGIVFGHEVYGVSEDILAMADGVIQLPMLGIKNTLNVATACGVVLFEALRQRWASGGLERSDG
jgi:tRNA G18 (ribose-2'-O)-methylase SpoU